MDFELKGRNFVVTGGTSGIGRGIVLALLDQGATVTTCYTRQNEAVESLAAEVAGRPAEARLVRADVRDADQVQRLLDEACGTFGLLHGLVNNAGVISHSPLEQLAPAEWDRIIDTNVKGMYNTVRGAIGRFGNPASVVNISSGVAMAGMPNAAHYVTSKAAILGFTRAMCKELGPQGVRVNAVASGIVAGTGQRGPNGDAGMAMYVNMTSLRRLGAPADIADVVLFLLSDAARYVTGAVVAADGGI
jgi:3-oxoacyl-[acyl-carrier protein] reductase